MFTKANLQYGTTPFFADRLKEVPRSIKAFSKTPACITYPLDYKTKPHSEMLDDIIEHLEENRPWTDAETAALTPANESEDAPNDASDAESDAESEAVPGDAEAEAVDVLESRMARFVLSLRTLKKNWQTEIESKPVDDEGRLDWEEWIEDNHKVGFIMDGQHRVWGAEAVNPDVCKHLKDEEEPVLSVTLIPGMPMAEQVFHFAMMNITPEKVKPGQARSNASFSLTEKEFNDYKPRLDLHIDTTDTTWMDRIDRDPKSPFCGMITYDYLGTDAESRFVQEKVMVQIAQQWRMKDSKDTILKDLYLGASVWATDKDEFRMSSFFRFWTKVKDRFPKDWDNSGSNLWKKVSLWVLQDFVRGHMANQVELWAESRLHPMEDLDSLGEFVDFVIKNIPEDFFLNKWNHIDDTTDGRKELRGHMVDQYKLAKVDKRKKLYKGA